MAAKKITVAFFALPSGSEPARSTLKDRIARVLFCIEGDKMVLLHGFIKKSQSTPQKELTLARNRMKAVKRQARGKDEEEQEEPAHWVQPRVVPRGGRHSRAGKDDGDQARARLAISELMKKQRVSKVTMAKRMRTSRAALDRLLDADNTSVTLQTMGRAAAVLGKELSITLKDAA